MKYVKTLDQVDAHLESHRAFLKANSAADRFVVCGRQVPRTGGVILARAESKEQLRETLRQDPFSQADVAEYDIIEVTPTMYHSAFADFTK